MRVLFGCSLGGQGHLIPLAEIGHAVERAGHDALLLVPPSLARAAEGSGLRYRVGDEPSRDFVDEIWRRVRAGPPDAVAGLIDRELFADRCTGAMLGEARAVCEEWRPQLVVRDPCEYASAIAAHEAGVAHAQVGISLSGLEFDVRAMVAPVIDRFASGVAAAIVTAPYLTSFPPSLDRSPWPDTRRFRGTSATADGTPERSRGDEKPLVYVSFGSVLGHLPEAVGAYRIALEAVAGLPARVLVTVGHAVDPVSLGPIPENTRVEPWVRQEEVLGRAHVVICHGGSGTTFGALGAGVPVVLYPMFADQPQNARVVHDAGAGVVAGSGQLGDGGLRVARQADALAIRAAVEEVLNNATYRRAARRIADEMAALPRLDEVMVPLLSRRRRRE